MADGSIQTAASEAALSLDGITCTFVSRDAAGGRYTAVRDTTLTVAPGEFVSVVGPTGCGKSTLIKMLIREIQPASGKVLIAGRDINELPASKVPLLRRRIGTIFQDFKLLPNRTVYDNVAYALQVIGASRAEIRRKTPEIIRLVGLQSKIHNYPDQLSGGEQQRVALARAFVGRPRILFADEPTGNLDPSTAEQVFQELIDLVVRTGVAALIATHNMELAARMHRVLRLEGGVLVEVSPSAVA